MNEILNDGNLRKCGLLNGILFSLKREGNPVICNNMDEPGGHYGKWSKPSTETQMPHDLTYLCNLKQRNSKK